MTDIFDRIEKHTGGPLGQYAAKAFGYYMFPKLEGELGPHMKFQGKDVLVPVNHSESQNGWHLHTPQLPR